MHEYFLQTGSPVFQKTLNYCKKVANSDVNVLLIGESGTGKEVAARYIHSLSRRRNKSFVAVNCSAFSETLLESELFGHEQGSFTGATKSRHGKIHSANEGTLFLDEIGDTNPATQIKLLRVIESKYVETIGKDTPSYVDFRLISATNKDLNEALRSSIFREDFFYRISTIVIRIPALRERKEDLRPLIEFFMQKAQEENNITITDMVPEVHRFITEYDYPGNIRELKNIIDRMVILSEDGVITKDCLPILHSMSSHAENAKTKNAGTPSVQEHEFLPVVGGTAGSFTGSPQPWESEKNQEDILPFKEYKKQMEAQYLTRILQQCGGNVAEAARRLKMSTRQLFNKINEYGIKR